MILTRRRARALQGLLVESERHAYELYYEVPVHQIFSQLREVKGTRGGIRRLALSFYPSTPILIPFYLSIPTVEGDEFVPLRGFHMTS
jgi:hypothetical protein